LTLESGLKSFDHKAEARRFALFVTLGACAAAANWLARFPLEHFMSFSAAVIVAYMVGMVIAFALFSRYVFPASPQPLHEQIKFFVLVNVAGVLQVWAVSMTLLYYVFPFMAFTGALAEPVAHGLAIGVPTVSSYFGHKYLTFRGH
jgi:energy-coupling factor transport system substrate-specific component